jgi:hypothetical protein
VVTYKDPNLGQEEQRRAPLPSESGAEKDKLEQMPQQQNRFLALVVVAVFLDIATLAFLALSAVIAAKYFPDVPEKLARTWKILGVLILALSIAAKLVIAKSESLILPQRDAANFSSVLRRQGRNQKRLTVWFDLRLIIRSLWLGLIALILAERFALVRILNCTAALFFLISAAVVAINLLRARSQMPTTDDSAIGALRLQIAQTRYRIRFARNIWYFVIPFCVAFGLLAQNIPISKGVIPALASAVSPSLGLVIGLFFVAMAILGVAFVLRAQIRFIRGRQNHAGEQLRQLEHLLAELSGNRG